MEEVIVGNIEELCEKVQGREVYIYGAKTIALRTCKVLEFSGGRTFGAMWCQINMTIQQV